MNEDVLSAKIETIRRCILRIREHLPQSAEELSRNLDAQDIISINLERAIQACVDVASHKIADLETPPAQTMGESFACLAKQNIISDNLAQKLRKAVGFRNIAVHDYQSVSWDIVFSICTRELTVFEEFIAAIFK
jgi:uncharacterized protein YutE (UPF0331/DUF86 family)